MQVKTYSLKKDGEKKLSNHFKVKEFRCKDGTDKILISSELAETLEKLREYIGAKSITINSGYRTPEYCVKIGSFKTSKHTLGIAADIVAKRQDGTYFTSAEICCAMEDLSLPCGVGRINKERAVHIDTRGRRCFFDELNGNKTLSSWYSYLGIRKKGDVNGDGKITAADAREVLRASADLEKLNSTEQKAADVNGDGKVNAADAREILRESAGK